MKTHQDVVGSSRAEVGEIDTSAPFESVKAAVSMFGESAFSRYESTMRKPKSQPSEMIFSKDTQLHLAQKELNRYKEQLQNCQLTRVQALDELEKAKTTVTELTKKLKAIHQSRERKTRAAETVDTQSVEVEDSLCSQDANGDVWKEELASAREQYAITIAELDTAKQEFRRIKKEYEASEKAKTSSIEKKEEAKEFADTNTEQANHLSKEVSSVQESLVHVKLASVQAKEEELKILAEKGTLLQSYKFTLAETEKKIASLKEQFNAGHVADLEAKLVQTTTEIGLLQQEIEDSRNSDLNSVITIKTELDVTKGVLQKVVEEESAIQNLLESLRSELENVKKEHLELKEKEAEIESFAADLNIMLQNCKFELDKAISGESKARKSLNDLMSSLEKLSSESSNAKKATGVMRKNTKELTEEAEKDQIALSEAEEKLRLAQIDAEEAKNAEANAQNQIKLLSEKASHARTSTSATGANIILSVEEFESLSHKAEESHMLAEVRIAAAIAQVEAIRASENETAKKLEVIHEEAKEIESAIQEAIKRAEMAEAARLAIEGEVKRRRDREQKRFAEAESQKPPESDLNKESLPTKARVAKPNTMTIESMMQKTTVSKRTALPNLSGILHGRKKQTEGGSRSSVPSGKSGLLVLLD